VHICAVLGSVETVSTAGTPKRGRGAAKQQPWRRSR
jgi:hypothetical protein